MAYLAFKLQNTLNGNDKSEHIPYLENVVRIIIVWSATEHRQIVRFAGVFLSGGVPWRRNLSCGGKPHLV